MAAKVLYISVLIPIGKELHNKCKIAIISNSCECRENSNVLHDSFLKLETDNVSQDQGWVL